MCVKISTYLFQFSVHKGFLCWYSVVNMLLIVIIIIALHVLRVWQLRDHVVQPGIGFRALDK